MLLRRGKWKTWGQKSFDHSDLATCIDIKLDSINSIQITHDFILSGRCGGAAFTSKDTCLGHTHLFHKIRVTWNNETTRKGKCTRRFLYNKSLFLYFIIFKSENLLYFKK